ncbi:MAG: DUF4105 domain-containing protein [Prevotellaceae bacterium]|jgi:hypothetical protein|nr:DUF4105 domain-containing protein [Prevotellaceae bacterium]
MRKLTLIIGLCVSVFASANVTLSDSAKISLLTCEPGTAVYARFGHSAIRVCDLENNLDYAYNYGIFDFSSKFFLARFIQGATDYMLEPFSMEYFYESYVARHSTVYEQTLDLSKEEKQALYDALETNYLPENRVYRYNFIYDNCATRPFYMIMKHLTQSPIITFDYKPTTYRNIVEEYTGRNTWLRFGIDILIGREADERITAESLIAFPLYTMKTVGSIVLESDSGSKPLVSEAKTLCTFPLISAEEKTLFNPQVICCLIMILVVFLSYFSWKNKSYFAWLDFILFLVSGLLGLIVFYLTFFSSHPLVDYNLNLLWMNPLQLLFALLLFKTSLRRHLSYFALFNTFTILLAIIVLVTRFQVMNAAFLPLMAMMLVRSILFYQMNNGSNE